MPEDPLRPTPPARSNCQVTDRFTRQGGPPPTTKGLQAKGSGPPFGLFIRGRGNRRRLPRTPCPLAIYIIDSIFILGNIDDGNSQGNKPGCARNPFGFILPVAAWLLLLHLGTSSLGPCSSRLDVNACSNRNCQRTSKLTRYLPGLQRRELLNASGAPIGTPATVTSQPDDGSISHRRSRPRRSGSHRRWCNPSPPR